MILTSHIPENSSDFQRKVVRISEQLGIAPDWLMGVMFFESRLKKNAYNKVSGAIGLIQFMPFVYREYGLAASDFSSMSNVKQLDYVLRYYKPYVGKMKSFTDLYLVTFFPVAVGKPDNYVLETQKIRAEIIAKQNPGFDANKDKKITVGEIKGFLFEHFTKILTAGELGILFGNSNVVSGGKSGFLLLFSALILGAGTGIYLGKK